MIWVWNLLPVVFGCCPPSSPALALTLALTPGGKWCRPTDPTMLILSVHSVDYFADTFSTPCWLLRWYFADHTAPVWYVQQGTHICASVARRAPLQKGTFETLQGSLCYVMLILSTRHTAFTVLILHWYCANALLISALLQKGTLETLQGNLC